jgi:hypothetical protein
MDKTSSGSGLGDRAVTNPFLTPVEEIIIDLVFDWLGESRINRKFDEYVAIAHRFPKVDAAHAFVNERLERIAKVGRAPYEICDFRPGDASRRYRPFPTSVSREVVRTAIKKFGIFRLRELHPGAVKKSQSNQAAGAQVLPTR